MSFGRRFARARRYGARSLQSLPLSLKPPERHRPNSSKLFVNFIKRQVAFETATVRAAVAGDDTGEAADWVAVDRVVDRAVADTFVVHFTNDRFESGDIL